MEDYDGGCGCRECDLGIVLWQGGKPVSLVAGAVVKDR